jgi:hypothetical protein
MDGSFRLPGDRNKPKGMNLVDDDDSVGGGRDVHETF